MASTNTLEIIIKASDQASKTLTGVINKTSDSLVGLGKNMMKTGAVMTAATAPFAGALISSIRSAGQFEESMANVNSVLQLDRDSLHYLSADILNMGMKARAGPQEVATAFYDIVGGVADASTHMAILDAAIKTSEAGNADLGATTSALIAIMNSYGMSAEEAGFASDVLTQTVASGVGSMDEFASALPQVTGLADSLGIGFDDLGAAMAFITTKGFSASDASTQLKAAMTSMINPNEAMITSLQELGYESGEAAIEELGLAGAFAALSEESPTFQDNMAGALGSVEALNGVIALSDENFTEFEKNFKDSADGATEAARAIQLDTLNAQTDLLKSNMEGLKIVIGTALLPVVNRLVRSLQPVLQGIIGWARANPELVQKIGMVVAIVGGLGIGLTVLGSVLAAVGGSFALLLGPLGLIIAAIAAFGLAYKTNFLGFADFIDGLINSVGRLAGEIKSAFEDEGLAGVGKLLLDKIAGGIGDLPTWAKDHIITPVINAIKGTDWAEVAASGLAIMQSIADGLGDIGMWLRFNIIYPLVEKILFTDWGEVANTGLNILKGIGQGLLTIGQWITDNITLPVINALLTADWSSILQTGANILLKIAEAWLDLATWVLDNLLIPLGEGILEGATIVYDKAVELGGQILQGIVDALAGLPGKILELIMGAIPTSINLPSININPFGGGGSESAPAPAGQAPGGGNPAGHALGGPVSAGMPYIVGERGAELFVPRTSGRIIPHGDLTGARGGGAGGTMYNFNGANIVLPGVSNARQFFDDLEREARRRNRKLAGSVAGL